MTEIRRRATFALDFETFDENIIFNILKRVEAYTLYNLRVVCKQWYNLILFDPQFANSNLSYAKPCIMLQTLVYDSYKLSFIEMMKGGDIMVHDLNMSLEKPVIASCHGLILIQDLPKFGDFFIGNLLTRKAIKVPLHLHGFPSYKAFGFTYIPQTRQYKIVCQMFDVRIPSWVCMILTLGSNEWRQVKGPQLQKFYDGSSISINSFVHSLTSNGGRDFLFSIDTADETSHKTALPYCKAKCPYLVDLGGVLSFVRAYRNGVEIWVPEDFYKKEWIRRHCINHQFASVFYCKDFKKYVPIGSLGSGKVILFVDISVDYGSCFAVDLELQKVWKAFGVKANRRYCIQYFNSLISSK